MKPFLGEIMLTTFDFAPKGWALCNGQLLSISQNEPLFAIIGTTYGGDGVTAFALPNLQGRTAIHWDNIHPLGSSGGEESHTLTRSEMSTHTHIAQGNKSNGNATTPVNNLWAVTKNTNAYGAASNAALSPTTGANSGKGQPHENMPPFLVLNFIIALEGSLPPRN